MQASSHYTSTQIASAARNPSRAIICRCPASGASRMNLHNRWWNSSRRLRDARRMSPVASQRLRKARKNNPPMVHDLSSYFCLFCFEQISLYVAGASKLHCTGSCVFWKFRTSFGINHYSFRYMNRTQLSLSPHPESYQSVHLCSPGNMIGSGFVANFLKGRRSGHRWTQLCSECGELLKCRLATR
ncbi:hypothetical protein ACVMIX_006414 [Rhizobium leguminosarum]